MTPTAHAHAGSKHSYIRLVRLEACRLAQERGSFDADDLWKRIPKPPPGIDPRVIGPALRGLQCDGLIEHVQYKRLDVVRTHGRPQSVRNAKDPAEIAEWLRQHPPGEQDKPTTIQLELPI
jgi:hypothetical protein